MPEILKFKGRTPDQIAALKLEGYPVVPVSNSSCTLLAESWSDLAERINHSYDMALGGYGPAMEAIQAQAPTGGDRTGRDDRWIRTRRRGHLTAFASIRRYVTKMAEAKAQPVVAPVIDPKVEAKVARERKAQEKREAKKLAKKNGEGPPCQCKCGGTTGGGKYLPGHDAKHKSALVKLALGSDVDASLIATAALEAKGWTKFLDKARESRSKPASVKRVERIEDAEERARQNIERLNLMKRAAKVLQEQGRYEKSSPDYLEITSSNAQAIIDGEA